MKVGRHTALIVVFSIILQFTAYSQVIKPSIFAAPTGLMAISDSTDNFEYGGGFNIGADFKFSFSSLFFSRLSLGYDYLPINFTTDTMSVLSFGAGGGIKLSVLPFMDLKFYGLGGYYWGIIDADNSGSDFFFTGGLEAVFKIGSSLSLGVWTFYKNLLSTSAESPSGSLFQGIGAQLFARLELGNSPKPNLKFIDIITEPIFPIFYSNYENNSFGEVVIVNDSGSKVTNLEVSVFIPQYMDKPRVTSRISELKGGKEKKILLSALFNDSILEVTEGSKVSMELIIDYNYNGESVTDKQVETVEILYRNAMTWDDDRKAASFITAKDPDILRFSKNITSAIRSISNNAINNNFRIAMGLFEALGEYGMGYVIDPN